MKWIFALAVAAGLLTGCQGLFAPSGCTDPIVVTDSMRVSGDTVVHVDTIARFRLCAS